MPGGRIETRALARSWKDGNGVSHALRAVDLTIEPGERVALTGTSGSGKSTLLHVLGGLDRGYAGDVRIDGISLGSLDDAALARFRAERLGFVFQQFNLLPHLTVLENVLLPATFGARVDAPERRARELIATVGLAGREDSFPTRLSGGQQQRVAIARALLGRTAILLCDEPTGNLDHATSRQVMDLLLECAAQHGATLIVVTHEDDVRDRLDRHLVLRDGAIVDDRRRPAGSGADGDRATSPGDVSPVAAASHERDADPSSPGRAQDAAAEHE